MLFLECEVSMISVAVIDDEIDARDKMIKVINQEGYGISIVGTAANGIDAYNLICKEKPVVTLIDIEMPGLSGLDVIKKIYDQKNISTAFIIISSNSNFSYAKDAISLGVVDYVLKPFLPQELINSIYRAVKRLCVHQIQAHFESADQKCTSLYEQKVGINYPFILEQDIIHKVLAGQTLDAKTSLNNFFCKVKESNFDSDIIHCYLSLCFEFLQLIKDKDLAFEGFEMNVGQIVLDPPAFEAILLDLCNKLTLEFSKSDLSATIILRAKQYIEEHYQENLTLNQVAQAVFVSPNYLSSLFMRHMNMHFTDCIQRVRINRAQELIKNEPNLKNYEIAEKVGFCSVKYFSAVFTKVVGMNVSQYRTKLYGSTQSTP